MRLARPQPFIIWIYIHLYNQCLPLKKFECYTPTCNRVQLIQYDVLKFVCNLRNIYWILRELRVSSDNKIDHHDTHCLTEILLIVM
jgi:hypothetical protein